MEMHVKGAIGTWQNITL